MQTIILGGGLSGLSASYYLLKTRPQYGIKLIEASCRSGGWIKSFTQSDGVIFEQGPRTVRPKGAAGANTLKLVEDLGLSDKVRPIPASHPAATKRMIFVNDELHLLPTNFKSLFLKQKPFSKPLISYLMNDFSAPHQKMPNRDESIYNFVERRFGKEVGDYLIAPMICGICGGDAKEISVKFLMENIFEKEQKHGSVVKGMIASLLEKSAKEPSTSNLYKRSLEEHWSVYSFAGGIEILPQKLEEIARIRGVQFQMNTKCTSIEFLNDKVSVKLANGETETCDHLISCIPAEELSRLVEQQHPKLSARLRKIKSVSVAVVNLQYNQKLLPEDGFGFLVCPIENRPILGVIYDSCCFSYSDKTVLTVMLGGHWFNKYFSDKTTEAEFLNVALQQVGDILKIDKRPDNYKVNILKNAIPQYTVGHKENLHEINAYLSDTNLNMSLGGCSYNGVGINDVILSAQAAVEKLK